MLERSDHLSKSDYAKKWRLAHPESIKKYALKNKDKRRMRYYKDVALSRKKAREKRKLYRLKNKEKCLIYWRNYSKKNRAYRRTIEKQSKERFKQTKKYQILKLIKTLKKIIANKKHQEKLQIQTRIIEKKIKKKLLSNLVFMLKKVKKQKHKEFITKQKEIRIKQAQEKKDKQNAFENALQLQTKRPIKNIKNSLKQKLRITYKTCEKLNEYLLWYINETKICSFCGVSEESLTNRIDLNTKSLYLEIDRKDPAKNYELTNIHLVCNVCNSAKLHIFTCEEMKIIAQKFILPKWNNQSFILKSSTNEHFIKEQQHNINNNLINIPSKNKKNKEYKIWLRLKRRAQKSEQKDSTLPFNDFFSWYKTQDRHCIYCNIPENLLNLSKIKPLFSWCSDRLTIDRIISYESYTLNNIVLSCLACNTIKSNIFTYEEMKEIGIYLEQKWKALI